MKISFARLFISTCCLLFIAKLGWISKNIHRRCWQCWFEANAKNPSFIAWSRWWVQRIYLFNHQFEKSTLGVSLLFSELVMGKNTMMKKTIRGLIAKNPNLEKLIPHVFENIGFVFTKGDLSLIREKLLENKVRRCKAEENSAKLRKCYFHLWFSGRCSSSCWCYCARRRHHSSSSDEFRSRKNKLLSSPSNPDENYTWYYWNHRTWI